MNQFALTDVRHYLSPCSIGSSLNAPQSEFFMDFLEDALFHNMADSFEVCFLTSC